MIITIRSVCKDYNTGVAIENNPIIFVIDKNKFYAGQPITSIPFWRQSDIGGIIPNSPVAGQTTVVRQIQPQLPQHQLDVNSRGAFLVAQVRGAGFRFQVSGFRFQGLGFRVCQGSGC